MDRKTGLGGTDISAICGLDPRRSAFDVYCSKVGLLVDVPREENERMWAGKKLERAIADMYSDREGKPIKWSDKIDRHHERPWQLASADFFVDSKPERIGADSKNVSWEFSHLWGEDGSDDVPDWISMQMHWYLAFYDIEQWHIAALFGGNDFRVFKLKRDFELEEMLLDAGERFWRDHVEAGVPPEMTATPTAYAYLRARFPRNSGAMRTPTGDEAVLIEEFLSARAAHRATEKVYQDAEVKLKAAIGNDDGFRLHNGRVTYKKIADTLGIDYEALAHWSAGDDYEHLAAQFHGVTRYGYRRLDVRVKE